MRYETHSIGVLTLEKIEWGKNKTGGHITCLIDETNKILKIRPAVDDTGSLQIGDGTLDMDVKVFLGDTTHYGMFNVGTQTLDVHGKQKFHAHLVTESYGAQFRTEYNAATGDFFGIDAEAHQQVSRTGGGVRGLSMCARVVAGTTVSSTANIIGGHFLLDNDGTLNGTGLHAALVAKVDAGGTFTAVGHLASLWVDSLQEGTVTGSHELIYMTNNGASTMDQAIYLYGGNKISKLMELNTCGTMVGNKVDADVTFAHYKKIAITIDGAAYWLVAGSDS